MVPREKLTFLVGSRDPANEEDQLAIVQSTSTPLANGEFDVAAVPKRRLSASRCADWGKILT